MIWANYDVAGNDQTSQEVDLSCNYLGTMLMNIVGAPLSDYQKAQLSLREALPAINTTGYCDADGIWYLSEAARNSVEGMSQAGADATEARRRLSLMQYLKLFDHGDGIFTKTLQSAANETDPNLDPGTTKIK